MSNYKHNPYVGSFHSVNRYVVNPSINIIDSKRGLLPMFRHAPPINGLGIGLKGILLKEDLLQKPFLNQIDLSKEKLLINKKQLHPDILKGLPLSIFNTDSSESDVEGDYPVCSICLDMFTDGDELRTLECSHCYHRKCIDIWLIGCLSSDQIDSCNCPQCRQIVNTYTNDENEHLVVDCNQIPSDVYFRIGQSLSRLNENEFYYDLSSADIEGEDDEEEVDLLTSSSIENNQLNEIMKDLAINFDMNITDIQNNNNDINSDNNNSDNINNNDNNDIPSSMLGSIYDDCGFPLLNESET